MIKNKRIMLFLLLCLSSGIGAQNMGYTIKGIVKDPTNGEPLMGAYITTGKRGGQTDSKGEFTIKDIPAGKVKLSSMYFSSYPMVIHEFVLKQDTVITFYLKEDALNLDEVVVTGTRTEKRLSNTPILTTVIKDREMIKSGSVSALESLQDNIPGIVISPNAMGNNMRIKGLNSRYILFLIDGERMVSSGAGGNVNLDQIDVNNIDRIEMINGAASALYGSNAVGAVVNFITKKPIHKTQAGANVSLASNNTQKMQVSVSSKMKKTTSSISAFRHTSDGFGSDGVGAYAARYSDWGGNAKVGYQFIKQFDVQVLGRFFKHETFNPEGSMNVEHDLSRELTLGTKMTYSSLDKRNNMRLSVNWDKYFDYNVMEKQMDVKEKDKTSGYLSTRLVNTFEAADALELIGGIEYNHQNIFSTTTLGPVPTSKSVNDGSLFAQADWELLTDFDVILGARYTYNEQFKSAFSPKLSVMYKTGSFKFRGGVGSAFRAPSLKELYYNFNHNGMFWVYGNPDLQAEKGLYNSLSVEFTQGLFNASISAYYNDIDNKITLYDLINENKADEKHYKNVSSATLKGLDVNLSYLMLNQFMLKGTFSYCDAKDNATGLQLTSNVKYSGTTSLTWNGKVAKSPFSLQFAGRMNSPILYQEVLTADDGTQTTDLSESKTYSIWKAILVKPLRIQKHTLELTLKCDNIFNFKESSYINSGREYRIGLRYAFK